MKLGVDFGTTRTVVAYADRGNYPALSFLDDNGDAHDWFPSVVAEHKGELRFGFDALAASRADSTQTVTRSFKRFLAAPDAVPARPVAIGSLVLSLEELITRYLEALKKAILTRSNLPAALRKKPALESTVAVPANAPAAQRIITLDAFRAAGFAPSAMLNEPSAAGFEYAHRHRGTLTSRRDHVVVYDLGGGTFDASLLRMQERDHEVLATAGVNQLGGDDFDLMLLDLVLAQAGMSRDVVPGHALASLADQCRAAKESLNPSSRRITIDLEDALGPLAPTAQVSLNVAEFYEACMPLVDRSIEAMTPVMARLDGAVAEDLDGALEEIAGIYVVGGASELPIVARALRQRFGRRVHRSPYPSAAVAIGLAIASDEQAGFQLADRCSRTFGVFRESAAGEVVTLDPIFTAETALPARAGESVSICRQYRAAHNVGHFRFFECGSVSADGLPRGEMILSGDIRFPFDAQLRGAQVDLKRVPVHRMADEGPRIEEKFVLDANGIVAVTIRNVDAGYEQAYRLGSG